MTDIRSRVAECVARSWFETQTTLGEIGMTWDHVPQKLRDNSITSLLPITDALLSLPGIAITDEIVWYITTDTFDRGGRIIAGPFPTTEDATRMRARIERYSGSTTYWIDKRPLAAAVQAQEEQP